MVRKKKKDNQTIRDHIKRQYTLWIDNQSIKGRDNYFQYTCVCLPRLFHGCPVTVFNRNPVTAAEMNETTCRVRNIVECTEHCDGYSSKPNQNNKSNMPGLETMAPSKCISRRSCARTADGRAWYFFAAQVRRTEIEASGAVIACRVSHGRWLAARHSMLKPATAVWIDLILGKW